MFTLIYTDQVTVPPELLSWRRLFVAYAGSAVGIAGAASVTMSLVLATVHRVVPERAVPTGPTGAGRRRRRAVMMRTRRRRVSRPPAVAPSSVPVRFG